MQISKEQYITTFNALPESVRSFLISDEFNPTIATIGKTYNLHVDIVGLLAEMTSYMLMGLISPSQILDELGKAGVDQETSKQILSDINTKVFAPIREEMQKNNEKIGSPTKPATEQSSSEPVAIPSVRSAVDRTPVPIYSPLPTSAVSVAPISAPIVVERPQPKPVLPPPNLPGQFPEPPAPRPTPPPHIEVPALSVTKPVEQVVVRSEPPHTDPHARIIHTMAKDMEALKGGVDPLRVAHPAPPAWAEASNKPAPVIPPPAPVVPPTPQIAQPPRPVAPPTPQAPVVHEAPHSQDALRTHLKQYGVDPYREPVE